MYQVKKSFTSGDLKGLVIREFTEVEFAIGDEFVSTSGSGYVIQSVKRLY